MCTGGIAKPDKFDCFRREYIVGMLWDAAEAMPVRKRREFRKFLKSLPTGTVFDDANKTRVELSGGTGEGSDTGLGTHSHSGTPLAASPPETGL